MAFFVVSTIMKRTSLVVGLFLAAFILGIFIQMYTPRASQDDNGGKEHFMQKEIGMPIDVGTSPINATYPLLGSEPKPLPERPYEQANDTELFLFQNNEVSSECCPSPFTTGGGCVCLTEGQLQTFASRGGNRIL